MNFLIIASTLILAAAIAIASSKSQKSAAAMEQEYWKRERAANSTRRKPLDNLDYIKVPMEIFPSSSTASMRFSASRRTSSGSLDAEAQSIFPEHPAVKTMVMATRQAANTFFPVIHSLPFSTFSHTKTLPGTDRSA